LSAAGGALNAIATAPRPSMLPDPAQLEMLRSGDGSLTRTAINTVRGRGRPPGAKNKRAKKIADYFVGKYGDPLDVLGQIMNTPLKQLVEVLMEADGGAEHRERLAEMVDEAVDHIRALSKVKWPVGDGKSASDVASDLEEAIEKLARAAQAISGKPGKLALDALSLQLQATFRALEYVHGKQPISVEVAGKADLVIFAPEILRQHGINPEDVQGAVERGGLDAFDAETLRIVNQVEDAEFSEADEGDNG
jgi:hypothetical protein